MNFKEKSQEMSRIQIQQILDDFCRRPSLTELPLPPVLSKLDRYYVHKLCTKMGLVSKSQGDSTSRYVVVRKKLMFSDPNRPVPRIGRPMTGSLELPLKTFEDLTNFANLFPFDLTASQNFKSGFESHSSNATSRVPDRLQFTPPKIPPPPSHNMLYSSFVEQRRSLPIFPYRQNILAAIQQRQVVLIVGETGSGKSTQVPQYILEDSTRFNRKCRIVCTQPRRIAAVTVSERCANERGEDIGSTVGYQIRLEKSISHSTLLTFCTNGILLRTLIGGHHSLMNLTCIIVDEVHERDRMSDFLLTVLRELLLLYPGVKLVLMSASLDVEKFRNYFPNSAVVDVPGRTFEVREHFLEDVLQFTNFKINRTNGFQRFSSAVERENDLNNSQNELPSMAAVADVAPPSLPEEQIKILSPKKIDEALQFAWLNAGLFELDDLVMDITQGVLKVNSQHSETGMTAFAIVAVRGTVEQVEKLLTIGVDDSTLNSAKNLAINFGRQDVLDCVENFYLKPKQIETAAADSSFETESQRLLNCYFGDNDDEQVDNQLILELINYILSISSAGAILIFLPGYESIMSIRDAILNDPRVSQKLTICILHSLMNANDQKEAFLPAPRGFRKIVLSTNIAEVSVTINDVVFVIDSGIMKERLYDACSGVSMLCNVWISKANALQRQGRAGRCSPGVCYRLYSRSKYENMSDNQVPEMLRVPIHELCLQTKLLFPSIGRVEEILSKAPDPPAPLILRSCVELLKTIGAMNKDENLTILGRKLTELPCDPQFAKVLLYSILMRCIEPLMIIIACLSYKDPFILPKVREERNAAIEARCAMASDNFSDHLVLLRAFDGWVNASKNYYDRQFCSQNFLSSSCMSMIYGIKEQMRAQLERLGYIGTTAENNYLALNANSSNWSVIKGVLVAGGYPCLAFVDHDRRKIRTKTENVEISIFSTLSNRKNLRSIAKLVDILPTDWIIYNELIRVRKNVQIKCATAVSPMTVALFAGPVNIGNESITVIKEHATMECWDDEINGMQTFGVVEHNVIQIDESIMLKTDPDKAKFVMNLRENIQRLFLQLLRIPWSSFSEKDEKVIKTVVSVLSSEDEQYGLGKADVRLPDAQVRRILPAARTFFRNKKRTN